MNKQTISIIFVAIVGSLALFYKLKFKKMKLAYLARKEFEKWENKDELDPEMSDTLVKYWQSAGMIWITKNNISEYDNEWAWSAAVISYLAQQVEPEFPKSTAHADYTVEARERRKEGQLNYIAFNPDEVKPKIGDIIVKKRAGGYMGDLDGLYSTAKSHGDIVTDSKGDRLILTGGNLSNTMKETELKLNQNGYIKNQSDIIAIIKM